MNANEPKWATAVSVIMLMLWSPAPVFSQNFDLNWYSVNGGGGLSTGGDFALMSTIAQPEAGSMAGGDFALTGGYMAASDPVCACPADMDGSGQRSGNDIQAFVACILSTGTNCGCADLDGDGVFGMTDVTLLVDILLAGTPCP